MPADALPGSTIPEDSGEDWRLEGHPAELRAFRAALAGK